MHMRHNAWSGLLAVGAASQVSSAEVVFQAWVEAPAVVERGSTFTASVWIGATGSTIDNEVNAFHTFVVDVIATGVDVALSEANFLVVGSSVGTPSDNALLEVAGVNLPVFWWAFTDANPLSLFTFEVALDPHETGTLELNLSQADGWDFMFSWWVDYQQLTYVFDTDPGSTRIVTPAVVRVVPEPASIGLLACAALAARRRR